MFRLTSLSYLNTDPNPGPSDGSAQGQAGVWERRHIHGEETADGSVNELLTAD